MADDFELGRFLFNEPVRGVPRHAWAVVSDPKKDQRLVLVNVSSQAPACCKNPTVVHAKEHPAVSKDSYLRCDRSKIGSLGSLEEALSKGLVQLSKSLSPETLAKLQKGVKDCPLVSREAKKILTDQGF